MKKKLLLLGLIPLLGFGAAVHQSSMPNFVRGPQGKFISDIAYSDRTTYCNRAMELNKKIAEEGTTLLKNKDGMLPFEGVKKVSIFGKSSTSLQYGGGGSGSGSVSSGITQIDMQRSLTDAGYEVNGTLTSFYKDNSKSGSGRKNGNSGWKGISEATVGETPVDRYTADIKSSFSEYGDAAIMVIARGGTEGADCKAIDARDFNSSDNGIAGDTWTDQHYLQLSDNENDLLDMIEEYFDKVVIVINSGNAFQCDRFEEDDGVGAVIWMGTPGANGTAAIGEILNGSVCPSGRTVDTWERNFKKNPTFQNFADNCQTNVVNGKDYPADTMFNADGTPVRSDGTYKGEPQWDNEAQKVVKYGLNGVRPSSYVSYEEGVYMDYRFYETMYDELKAESESKADEWYSGDEGVIYPFGYGLSYTEFEQEIVSCDKANAKLSYKDEKMTFKVKVTNKGSVTGKDVVQLYWKAPYIDGGIEKPSEVLCAFAKTKDLAPGESQELKLDFYIQDQASYDFTDANGNGFTGYELDPGDYKVTLNKNAHEVYDEVNFRVTQSGIKYKYDRVTGSEVKNRFTDRGFYNSLPGENDVGFDQTSRTDLAGTFPTHPTIEDRTLKEGSRVEEFYNHPFTLADIDCTDTYEYMPEAAHKTKQDFIDAGWTQQKTTLTASESTQFSEMVGVPLDDDRWEDFLNEFTFTELRQFVEGGNTHNPAISRIGKPSTSDSDGPSKFGAMWWCGAPIVAATYNVDLAFEQGECVGIEGHMDNKYGWAGPGVNLHRSPFGGRNFEYYSADPFLTGRIAGRVVAAASDKGIYCYFKHFAVNDQERNREGVTCFLTEQALRELYLKPFQMCIEEGKSMGIMSSYNRLGLMETAASYPLLTEVLRGEWGFKGAIISDMTHHGNSAFDGKCYENINNRVLAGCNNQLDGDKYSSDVNAKWDDNAFDGKGAPVFTYEGETVESYSWWYAVREMAKGAMYACANCGAMDREFAQKASGIVFSDVEGNFVQAKVGDEIEIGVEISGDYDIGATYGGKTIRNSEVVIDPVTPLPAGLDFDGSMIFGTAEEEFNGYVHVLINLEFEDNSTTIVGKSLELQIAPVCATDPNVDDPADPEPTKPTKKGCKGEVIATSAFILAVAGMTLGIALKKKREE